MNRSICTTATASALAFALVLGAGACSPTPTRESAGEYADATVLTTKVKATLARDEGFGSLVDVQVETFRDTVQLSGFVDSEADRQLAEQVARNVNGVSSVQNSIALKPQS